MYLPEDRERMDGERAWESAVPKHVHDRLAEEHRRRVRALLVILALLVAALVVLPLAVGPMPDDIRSVEAGRSVEVKR